MNLTLSLLAGLLLLLPGIAAVVAWNHGGGSPARRPELALTSVTTLLALLGLSILVHLLGYGLICLVRDALVDAGDLLSWSLGPVFADPYVTALQFTAGKLLDSAGATTPGQELGNLASFVAIVLVESVVAFLIVKNPGADIVVEPFDLRGQGWVYESIVKPQRYGYTPIAYVFTNITSGDRGVGYEGVVADIRQGADGEIKALCLGEPSRFVYELRDAKPKKLLKAGRSEPDVEIYDSEPIGGVIALEPATIRNVVVHLIKEEAVDEVAEEAGDVA